MFATAIPCFVLCLLFVSLPTSSAASIKRETFELNEDYDFIIAGGGTAGLTVADRLSEAFPNKSVLVVEYGEPEYARGQFDPPDVIFGAPTAAKRPGLWNFTSLPNPEMNNKTASVLVGKVVGGSSAINGMYFDRPSQTDFDAWRNVSRPEWEAMEDAWDWKGIWPYFRKSVMFTPPPSDVKKRLGYTWDISAYGGTTPIHSSFPPFQWGDHFVARNAWKDMLIPELAECAGGHKLGICWVPASQHPVTARRSHSGLGHYADVPRSNYHILVKHQVVRVIYPNGSTSGVPVVEIRSLANNQYSNITATAEVVICAGALHTPTILYRSGIGSSSILESYKIPLVIDLPGVGANLQDHSAPPLAWNYTQQTNFSPLPSNMFDPGFAEDAAVGFNETPARGPYTLAMSNSGIYISFPNITSDYRSIANSVRAVAQNGSASTYLPADYAGDKTLIAGYIRQLLILADLLEHPHAPSIEVPFASGTSTSAILLHPLSRGTVRLNITHPLEQPVLDYRAGSNPIDFQLHIAHLRYLRRMLSTPSMAALSAIEILPGINVTSDAALVNFVKERTLLSLLHPCCTTAMLPRELGGVVGPDLKVHGATGLRVVDIGVLPFLGSAHTSSTAYAIAEKAADIIIRSKTTSNTNDE